ncbi:hypothetical protein FQR65_LT03648 [Abscondita terminalis]|nr:hypothetical protein FQR65_LT03648 [Abscondita terminalis]
MSESGSTLVVSVEKGVRLIKFNNIKKKNAIPIRDFCKVLEILKEDVNNDGVVVTIVTGNGDYFTSGLQLDDPEVPDIQTFLNGIEGFINYPKLLIAVVNGPAIGYGICGLPLYDIVYASDRATFHAPFLNLEITPDLCTSYTFPRLMGKSLAWEVLFLGRVLNANEALQARLVSTVVPHEELDALMQKLLGFGNLPVHLIKTYKKLFNKPLEQKLLDANENEIESLFDCFANVIMTEGTLLVTLERGVRVIKFNNTNKKNAIPVLDFYKLFEIIQEDTNNHNVVVTIITGNGDYFTSGLQLDSPDTPDVNIGKKGIESLINYPKLIIAVVNGPAIGFGTCSLPLYDIVYASDRATFCAPFLNLELTPDLCTSYAFPRLMGKSLTWEVLLLGRVLNAKEAHRAHLVSTVVPHEELDALMRKLLGLGNLPVNLIKTFKKLFNKPMKQKLLDANENEIGTLFECFANGALLRSAKKLKNRNKL